MTGIMTGLYMFCLFATIPLIFGGNVHEMQINQEPIPFSWKNCNKTAAPMAFKELSISPDPIRFGANIKLSFSLEVTEDIGTPKILEADVDAEIIIKKRRFNICDGRPEYCHFDDLCQMIAPYKDECPEVLKKTELCHCPLKKKIYTVNDATILLPNPKIQMMGEFNVTINIHESGNPVGCLSMHFCIGSCS